MKANGLRLGLILGWLLLMACLLRLLWWGWRVLRAKLQPGWTRAIAGALLLSSAWTVVTFGVSLLVFALVMAD